MNTQKDYIYTLLNSLEQEPFFKRWLFNNFHTPCININPSKNYIINLIDYFSWDKTKEGFSFWNSIINRSSYKIKNSKLTFTKFKQLVFNKYKYSYPELII